MGQACFTGRQSLEEQNDKKKKTETGMVDMNPNAQVNRKQENANNSKLKQRKPTGKKVKKKTSVNLETINNKFESSQTTTIQTSGGGEVSDIDDQTVPEDADHNCKLPKVRFDSNEDVKEVEEDKLSTRIKRKLTGKCKKRTLNELTLINSLNATCLISNDITIEHLLSSPSQRTKQTIASFEENQGTNDINLKNDLTNEIGKENQATLASDSYPVEEESSQTHSNEIVIKTELKIHTRKRQSYTDMLKKRIAGTSKIPKLQKKDHKKDARSEVPPEEIKRIQSFIPKPNMRSN